MIPQFGQSTSRMSALPVIESPYLPDTEVMLTPGAVVVGTQPPTDPLVLAGREARLRVRRGLADVLAWLGQPVANEPMAAYLRELARGRA